MKARIAMMVALALLCALHAVALLRAPGAHYPERIGVSLAPGETIALGRHELAAPQAAVRQLALRRAPDGSWWLRNLQPQRPLLVLDQDGVERRSERTLLAAGQQLQIGPQRFTVGRASDGQLTLTGAGRRWHYDGAILRRDGQPLSACPEMALGERMRHWWNRWAPRAVAIARPLALGGNLHCGTRIGIAATEPGSAVVRAHASGIWLTAALPILVDGADPQATEFALDRVATLGIGRTRYNIAAEGAALQLHPQRERSLFAEPATSLPPQVSWTWTTPTWWSLPGQFSGAALLVLGCAVMLAARRRPGAPAAALVLAGVVALALQRGGAAPGIGPSLLLGWAALWCFTLLPRRLGPAAGVGILLLAIGLLVQLELALGAPSSNWARHLHKSCALLAIGLGAGSLLRLRGGAMAPQRQWELLLAALACSAIGALGLQVLLGDETGVFDVQPVEFAKLALSALSAHCIAVGLGWHAGPQQKPGQARSRLRRAVVLGAPVLLLAALCALALVQVNDFSPLLLLLVWCVGMTLAWAALTGRRGISALLLGACLLVGAGIGSLHGQPAQGDVHADFYAERFAVWRDPAAHPHTGQQMLLAGRAIAAGGWWGAGGLLGVPSLGQPAGGVLEIPAVQDDFAPAFFINRHGLASALLLWLLQALFVATLLHTAWSASRRGAAARDFRLAWMARFQCAFLCGGAAFVCGHLLLSWGTNLALLPIMGQPMSFLSAGGSHLLFFLCPLLTVAAISAAQWHPATAPSSTTPRPHHRRVDHAGLCTT